MLSKNQIRKKYSNLRKNKYFEISDKYYKPIIKLTNNKNYKCAVDDEDDDVDGDDDDGDN